VIVPISVEEQEVLCSNCYDTIPMNAVDSHSNLCFRNEPPMRPSHLESGRKTADITVDQEKEHIAMLEDLNNRISKLIKTLMRKLDSEVQLESTLQIYESNHANALDNNNKFDLTYDGRVDSKAPKTLEFGEATMKLVLATQRTATASADERSLIQEVVDCAEQALIGDLDDVLQAAERLDLL